jgi:hypothetical protein
MKIVCINGYYKFYEDKAGEIAQFNSRFSQDIKHYKDYYTFSTLANLPEYSLKGKLFSGLIATKTFFGEPWEILKANNFTYNFSTKLISYITLTGSFIKPVQLGNYKYTSGLILCGSITDTNSTKITGYTCKYDIDSALFKYSEFYYD